MELYIHIPFCVRKCKYCDFLSFCADEETKECYIEALCNEIAYFGAVLPEIIRENSRDPAERHENPVEICMKSVRESEEKVIKNEKNHAKSSKCGKIEVETIYLGGGTPTVIGADKLVKILQKVKEEFVVNDDAEITIECNPATIDKKGLEKLQKNGVNRLSIGLQSTFDDELELLGRIHNFNDFLQMFEDARVVGIKNLNVDLISALPKQTTEKYKMSLQKLIELQPEHISSYSLILEEGTPFYELYNGRYEMLPDEKTDREMYHLTKTMLKEAGYERYEISNYARPGFESKHNSGYWKRIPYFGFGLGASSLINNVRYRKKDDLADYLQFWKCKKELAKFKFDKNLQEELFEEIEVLTRRDQMAEFMFLGLRMTEGVTAKEFKNAFRKDIWKVYGDELDKLEKEGLLRIEKEGVNQRIYLTEFGMDVSNYVFEKFI